MMSFIIGIVAFAVTYNIWRYYHEDNDNDYSTVTPISTDNNKEEIAETHMEEKVATRQLVLETIESIGSEPGFTEDGRIRFDYQGTAFLMEASDGCLGVNLIWPWCYRCSKFDIDEFARVRQVVNEINLWGTVTVCYGITDSDDVAVHIKKHFLFLKEIPHLDYYLKAVIDSFFQTARELDVEIEKCRLAESGR
ncbi:MAG: hypothetical protein K6G08_05285 [Prevotella sp.]|nr:hypothetical protein [Prevotella sp.]